MKRSRTRPGRSSLVFAVGGVVALIGLVATSIVSARILGPDSFSTFAAWLAVLGILGTGAAGAMEQETARSVAQPSDQGVSPLPLPAAALTAVIAAMLALLPFTWQELMFGERVAVSIALLVVGIAVIYAAALSRGLLAGAGRTGTLGVAVGGAGVLPVIIGVLLVKLGLSAYLAFVVGTLIGWAFPVLFVGSTIRADQAAHLQWFGPLGDRRLWALVLGNLFLTANMVSVPALLRLHIDDIPASDIASAQVVVSISRMSTLLVAYFVPVAVAAAARRSQAMRAGPLAAAAFGAVAAVGTALVAPTLLPLVFGPQFQVSTSVALVASLSVVFLNPAYILMAVAVARRRTATVAVAWGGGAAILAVLAWWPHAINLGTLLWGVVLSSAVAVTVMALAVASPRGQDR